MRRVMEMFLSILILSVGLCGNAFAFSPDFHLGFESQISREVVTPSFFPILKTGFDAKSENYDLDLELKMSLNHAKVNAVSAKNIYYEVNGTDSPIISFGRKWMEWSQLDENWGLGVSNPLDSWDRLRSTSQGLTGIFLSHNIENLRLNLFVSYLSIPEISPNVVIENHRFEFYHPQSVSAGPQTFDLLNRSTPLGYNLLIPNLSSIIFRPSVIFSIEPVKKNNPFSGKATFGYLPLNYFPIALQASLAIPLDQIVVDLRPRVLSHNIYNAEISYQLDKETIFGISELVDQIFTESYIPSDYTTAALGLTSYFSPWIKLGNFKFSHLYALGGIGNDTGPYANPIHNLFSSRILYKNATQLQLKIDEISAKFLHEFSVNANWVSLDWKHQWGKNFSSVIGGDLISAEKDAAYNGGAEFLSDLRALDRIRVGVSYAF